jgi:hypothetical protein
LVERKNVEREKIREKYRKEKYGRGKMSKLKIVRESDVLGDWRHGASIVQYCFPYNFTGLDY